MSAEEKATAVSAAAEEKAVAVDAVARGKATAVSDAADSSHSGTLTIARED